eukprot:g37464.t1
MLLSAGECMPASASSYDPAHLPSKFLHNANVTKLFTCQRSSHSELQSNSVCSTILPSPRFGGDDMSVAIVRSSGT